MNLIARLRKLEAAIGPTGPHCSTCGYPDSTTESGTIIVTGDGPIPEPRPCPACGRRLMGNGKPLADSACAVIIHLRPRHLAQ